MSGQLIDLQKLARTRRANWFLRQRRRAETALAVAFTVRSVAILARQIPAKKP